MQIDASARRHGVSDADMLHVVRMPLRLIRQRSDRVLHIGADPSGRLLEVVVLDAIDDEDEPTIIHAMPLRPKFYRYLAR